MLKKNTVLPTVSDEYRILEQIGQGGNGTVFRANNVNEENVAIKVIDKTKTSTEKLKRFKNELNFCQGNTHRNIINVIDSGAKKDDKLDIIFYVMPLYTKTLRDLMRETIAPEHIIEIFTQLMGALEYAHSKSIWHRDVKPENILIGNDGTVVLADFGIAHFSTDYIITTIETKATDKMANIQYSAPEQRTKGSSIDGTVDIYSAGLILNELFTGKVIGGSDYTKIADVHEDWSYLDRLVDGMIKQDAAQRLFPIEKVLFQLEVLDSDNKARIVLEKLAVPTPKNDSDEPHLVSEPVVINGDFDNNMLIMKLDRKMPLEWGDLLKHGHYGKTSCGNYPSRMFNLRNMDEITVPIRHDDERLMPDIIKYFKEWIGPVTNLYNQKVQREYDEKVRQQAEQHQREIEQAKRALKIKESVRSMF